MSLSRNTPLKRKTPLAKSCKAFKRKTPLNSAGEHATKRPLWERSKKRIEAKGFYKDKQPRKPLAKVSKKKQRQLRQYFPINRAFLARPEHHWCELCVCRSTEMHLEDYRAMIRDLGLRNVDVWLGHVAARMSRATEVHHARGRAGSLLTYVPAFVSSCRGCREWPHENTKRARELGLLAPAQLYQVVTPEVRTFDFETFYEDARDRC